MTPIRIAMWSGPRNISTAMMRAWDNRGDCQVVDEPFYSWYLTETGLDHPMRDAVIASQPADWRGAVAALFVPLPEGCGIQYQKQMAHHMVGDIGTDWYDDVTHAFLIRDPAEMIASYAEKRETVGAADLGLAKQVEIYETVRQRSGREPPVIDARDVLEHPAAMLSALCEALGVPYLDRMCHWPAGRRDSDGVWAPHWYNVVERSTGFAPYRPKDISLDAHQRRVFEQCSDDYAFFHARRLTP